jgi:hypothetical protein
MFNRQMLTDRKGWSSSLGVGQGRISRRRKKLTCFKMLHRASDLDGLFGTIWARENECEILNSECQTYVRITLIENSTKTNSEALVRQRTIPTERPPLVGEVNPNFSGCRVSRGQRDEFPRPLIFGFLNRSRYFSFK